MHNETSINLYYLNYDNIFFELNFYLGCFGLCTEVFGLKYYICADYFISELKL